MQQDDAITLKKYSSQNSAYWIKLCGAQPTESNHEYLFIYFLLLRLSILFSSNTRLTKTKFLFSMEVSHTLQIDALVAPHHVRGNHNHAIATEGYLLQVFNT